MTDKTTKNEMAAMAAMLSNPADVAFLFQIWEEREALRAELDAAPTATLRQQLAGSQSALSKVMGELTEARESAARRATEYAKVQAELYQKIEAEQAQTREAYRQRDVARDEAQRLTAELAQARATISVRNALHDEMIDNLQNMAAAMRDAEAERDDADDDLAKALSLLDKKDVTIRALVVAARAIHRTLWQALDQYEVNDRGIVRDMRQHVIGLNIERAEQSGQQAGE